MKLSEQLDGAAEDQIWKLKLVIGELSKYQDLLFNELVETLGFRDEKIKDFLFDYIHNSEEPIEFCEYLGERGH